ncbi:unnamed protein product [Protopolystoma xenopodis]|uniref:Uncharacterized protein n=1 Tax=Protopolystoma xenopodis TaxID=117903 RepID=A0A448WE46_9PLAT|nr:unnamed protein product [Protopolystoma xenopodis]
MFIPKRVYLTLLPTWEHEGASHHCRRFAFVFDRADKRLERTSKSIQSCMSCSNGANALGKHVFWRSAQQFGTFVCILHAAQHEAIG